MSSRDPMHGNPPPRRAGAAAAQAQALPAALMRAFRRETPREAVERAARAKPPAHGSGDLAFIAAMLAGRPDAARKG